MNACIQFSCIPISFRSSMAVCVNSVGPQRQAKWMQGPVHSTPDEPRFSNRRFLLIRPLRPCQESEPSDRTCIAVNLKQDTEHVTYRGVVFTGLRLQCIVGTSPQPWPWGYPPYEALRSCQSANPQPTRTAYRYKLQKSEFNGMYFVRTSKNVVPNMITGSILCRATKKITRK